MRTMKIDRIVTAFLKSNMYVISENGHAILIDPTEDASLEERFRSSGMCVDMILPTHEHYDHINGINRWKALFPQAEVICSAACAKGLESPKMNSSRYYEAFCLLQTWVKDQQPVKNVEYICHADRRYEKELQINWQNHSIVLREAPGHSPGSSLIVLDEMYLFPGDSLLKDRPAATRFPGGKTKQYNEQTIPVILSLNPEIMVYPGHMDRFRLGECMLWKESKN